MGFHVDRPVNHKGYPRETGFAGYNSLMRGRFGKDELGSEPLVQYSGASPRRLPASCILQPFSVGRRALKLQPQCSHFRNVLSYDDGSAGLRIANVAPISRFPDLQQSPFDCPAQLSGPLAAAPRDAGMLIGVGQIAHSTRNINDSFLCVASPLLLPRAYCWLLSADLSHDLVD